MPNGIRVLLLLGTIVVATHSMACRAEDAMTLPVSEKSAQGVVNQNPPAKHGRMGRTK